MSRIILHGRYGGGHKQIPDQDGSCRVARSSQTRKQCTANTLVALEGALQHIPRRYEAASIAGAVHVGYLDTTVEVTG